MHLAIDIAFRRAPSVVPDPVTGKDMRVAQGPQVADELTRNLRPWAQSFLRDQYTSTRSIMEAHRG